MGELVFSKRSSVEVAGIMLRHVLSNKRVIISVVCSVFLHVMLISMSADMLLSDSKYLSFRSLNVRLVAKQEVKHEVHKKVSTDTLLLNKKHASIEVPSSSEADQSGAAPPNNLTMTTHQDEVNNQQQINTDETPKNNFGGFGLPKFLGLPWAPKVSVRAPQQNENPAEAYHEMHQQALIAQRSRSLLLQIGSSLSFLMEQDNQMLNGQCTILKVIEGVDLQIKCDSPLLEEWLQRKKLPILGSLWPSREDSRMSFALLVTQNKVQILPNVESTP